MTSPDPDPDAWCSVASAWSGEPMPGTAPHADVWVVVEQQHGWGAAPLARSEHGVRVVMARPLRGHEGPPRAWIARADAPVPSLRRMPLADSDEVAGWDLAEVAAGEYDDRGEPIADPLLLICANGRRDRCCGHVGRRLARELAEHPSRLSGSILTSTHLGGHRFAPTALLLPWGVLHGRLDVDSATAVLSAARSGHCPAATLRGYSTLSAPAQVAEAHARVRTGHRGLAALPVRVDVDPAAERAHAVIDVPGYGPVSVYLRREVVEVLSSCGKHVEPTPRWVVAVDQAAGRA